MVTNFFIGTDIKGVKTKNEALESLALFLSKEMKANTDKILASIKQRENLANTGLEKGIAIPHVFIDGLNEAHVAVLVYDEPLIDWDCVDNSKVKVAIALVLPQDHDKDSEDVLKVIRISQSLADEEFIDDIVFADDACSIIDILNTRL